MAYQYDVFFSYKRDAQSDAWHDTVKEKLKFWLKLELKNPDVNIFFDRTELRIGSQWPHRLREALIASKTMICVWSPLYFQSRWCVSEWRTFVERERSCRRDLIAPASFQDGECFPPEARHKQFMDFSEYTSTAKYFWETAGAVNFETLCLKRFASDVAYLIKNAPPFQDDFPVIEAADADLSLQAPIGRIADA